MIEHTHHELASPQQIVLHAEASRYMTLVGFTILLWDHICTLDEEIQFIWTASRSWVKILFLVNRYSTLAFLAAAACQTSRLASYSDVGCGWSVEVIGFFEAVSLAMWDLFLLLRVHALWRKRRSIVVSTYLLYSMTYVCHVVVGLLGGVQLFSHMYFDPLAKTCVTDYRPIPFSIQWAFALFCETIMFILTIIKVIEDRRTDQFNNPLMESLYYGQLIYNVVIIVVRVFNLLVWITSPPSLFFLGVYFIWALIATFVTRMMLHLRWAASFDAQRSQTTLLGETAFSTRIVWARHASKTTAFSPDTHLADDRENAGRSSEDGESGERIELRSYRANRVPTNDNG